jgi:hypothetical protein
MEQILRFYQTPGTYTNPTDFRQFLQALPDDNAEIIRFIKKVLIHPIDAKNSSFRFDYKKALRSQIDHRSIDDILANPKVNALLKLNSLDFQAEPSERGILSCDHHAVFFAAILRLKGRAVRARCGYATYIATSKYIPHWICEVYDNHQQRWVPIDPERVKFEFNDGDFYQAGRVWLEVMAGRLEIAQVVPDYRRGLDGIKYRLLNDINALMKNELLNYDWILKDAGPKAPKIFSKPVIKLDEAESGLLDTLATLSLDVDANWGRIRDQYATYVQAKNLRTPE